MGGVLPQLGTGAHLGAGDVFVAGPTKSEAGRSELLSGDPKSSRMWSPITWIATTRAARSSKIFVEFARVAWFPVAFWCAEDEGAVPSLAVRPQWDCAS